MKKILIFIIIFYKKIISPIFTIYFGNACRFTPTCSEYTIEALEKYGAGKGMLLGIRRVAKCHPWNKGGLDPLTNNS